MCRIWKSLDESDTHANVTTGRVRHKCDSPPDSAQGERNGRTHLCCAALFCKSFGSTGGNPRPAEVISGRLCVGRVGVRGTGRARPGRSLSLTRLVRRSTPSGIPRRQEQGRRTLPAAGRDSEWLSRQREEHTETRRGRMKMA